MHTFLFPTRALPFANSPGESAHDAHVALAASLRPLVTAPARKGADARVRCLTRAGSVARSFAWLAAAVVFLAIGFGSANAAVPNDPRYRDQWSLNNTGASAGLAGADIMAEAAWGVLHDAPEIIVAVLDSGVRLTHEDLAGNLWVNPGESGLDTLGRDKRTNGVDDDGNGYVDDVHGINVLNHSGNPSDDWGHGTHVAGIVGAVGNNGLGIAGVTWRVKIMVCKFIDASGNYTIPDAIAALDYARSKGAKVVTAAWGKTTFTSAALRDAIIALRDANIILAAATGNDGGNNDTTPLYPASYEYSNVIAAAATDRTDALASFSNYGAQSVDLGAPGANVLSCWNGSNSDYRETSGTSFSAAHVAGACALLWARFPGDTHQQIINRILTTVDPLPGLAGKTVSGGRLNLAAALAPSAVPVITSATTASTTAGAAFSYQITASNSPVSYTATNLPGTGLSLNTTTGVISGTPTAAGTISSQLTASNGSGTSAAVTLTTTVNPPPGGDTTAPVISSFVFETADPTAHGSFVVTFSEPVTGVDATDFAINTQGTATATIASVAPINTTSYRLNFDYTGTSGSVQMAIKTSGTGIADTALNAFVGRGSAASDIVAFVASPPADSTPPVASAFTVGTPTTSSVNFTLTFNEPVTGVSADDFLVLRSTALTANLGTITASGAGTVYTIPVTFSGTGTLQLMVLGGTSANIRDAATNWYAGGSGQLSSTVTIAAGGSVPSITSAAAASATAGTAFSYQITATHSPTSYAATNLTGSGLSLNATTGLISGTPAAAGTISLQVTATNSTGTSTAVTLSITVSAPPGTDTTPPILSSFAFDTSTVTATSGTFVVTFSEPVTGVDASDFVISTQGTATTTTTGVTATSTTLYRVNFNYTGASGSVQAAIKTSDTGIVDVAANAFVGGGSAASDVVPFVASPPADSTPPVISTFTAGTPTASSVDFTLTFNEPVTGVNAADFVVLPAATLTVTLGTVTADGAGTVYTIPATFSGTGTLQLMVLGGATSNIRDTATNWFGGGSGQLSPTVTISASGAAPTITSATTAAATAGTTFSYQITATNSPTSYAATNLSGTGLLLNTSSGAISGSPSVAGTISSQLTATNSTGTSTAVTLTITVNAATAVPSITSAATASATVGTAFSYQITATHSPSSYAATNLSGTGLSLNTTTGLISGPPGAAGTISSQFTATNATGTSAAVTLTITVNAATAVPTITSAATASATTGTPFTYQITATNSPTSYAATNLTGTGLSLNTTSGVISGTPNAAGTISSQLTATNATGTSMPVTLAMTVAAAGSAPVITSSLTVGVTAGASFSYTVTASNSPTSFSATNLPGGLVFTSPTFTGAVSTAGTYNISLGAANAFGSSAKILVLTVTTAPPTGGGGGGAAPVAQQIIFAPGSAIVGESLTLTATSSTGLPVSFTLVSGNATLIGSTLTPQNAGAIVVRAFNNGNASTQAAFTHATINAKHRQTLTFNSPASSITINSPITLSATTSAGSLPITFTLVSGNATLNGNTLTPKGPGAIVLRASQAGNDTFVTASIDTNFGSPGKAPQSITCPIFSDTTVGSGPIPVPATASSGLPISLSVSGPARLSGNTIVLAGAPGTVTLRAAAPGNEVYNPASEVIRTFQVRAIGQQVYLGTMGPDPFAVVISQDGAKGLFVARLAASGEAIIVNFALQTDGSFHASAHSPLGTTPNDVSANATPATAALSAPRTLRGTVNNGVISGTIAELDTRFTANVSAPTGPTAALAGAYVASLPGSASGEVCIVVAPDGSAFAVALTPAGSTSGTGTIRPDGTLEIATAGGGSISGTVDSNTGMLTGALRTGASTSALVGLSEGTRRTDRLVNLSSRLRVVGGDANRSVIAGFVVAGTGAKPILVRAVGPGLTGFGVQDALANPRLQLYRGSTLVAENDDWSNNADVSATADGVGAFKLAANSRDAALLATVEPGAYTAIVTGVNGNGVVLVEVYDAATGTSIASRQLVNLSTRGFVDTGEGSLIAGFVVTGNAPKSVLIRGIGPGLTPFGVAGVLADPALKVYAAGSTAVVAQNDDWSLTQPVSASQTVASAAELSAAATASGAFALPAGSKDAALVITLAPGNYTAVVSGANTTTGVGLVEVYELPNP